MGGPAAWGLSGHRSAGGEQLHCASLVCIYISSSSTIIIIIIIVITIITIIFLFCPNKLSLSQPVDFIFPFLSPIPEREGGG